MPCDQRISLSVSDLAKVNRTRLAAVLQELGYTVTEDSTGLYARRGGVGLAISGSEASMTAYSELAAEVSHTQIRRAYAARTVQDVSKRFAFKVSAREQLADGSQRLTLRR